MSSLADELNDEPQRRRRCGTCEWYDEQADEDRAAFDAWIADGKPIAQLHRVCVKRGLPGPITTFQYHIDSHHVISC